MSKRLGGIIGLLCRCRCCLLFISQYNLIRYECSCGHKIDGIKPNQTGKNTIGGKKKQGISADGNHTYINININNILKKNQNTPRPSEHPPVRGKKCQNV